MVNNNTKQNPMKKFFLLMMPLLMLACSEQPVDELDLLPKFDSTWNIYEDCHRNDDGSVTYTSIPWGGLVGSMKKQNMPVDWSAFESITLEFAEPTTVETQIMFSERLKTRGKPGIKSLTCYFDGQDVTSVDEVVLQASDTATITVTKAFLTPNDGEWEATTVWEGNCSLGNWENGFVVKPEKLSSAYKGDKLEFIYSIDKSIHQTYWLMKTIYNGTDTTLEGNENELNKYGCVYLGGESTKYRIRLTEKDAANIREKGVFVNGFYCNVKKVNLLRKTYVIGAESGKEEEKPM